jgi:O-antigen/teichoic acid export membrane protein
VWGYGLLSLHLHKLILIFNLSMLALVTVLVAALIPLDGAQGAAIGVAAAEVVGAIAGGLLLARGRPHLAPRLRVLPRVTLAALLGATPALAVGLPVVVRVILSTVIYGAVVLALKAPPAELYEALPSWLRRASSAT